MAVLITGITGYVATWLAGSLVGKKEVIGLTRSVPPLNDRIQGVTYIKGSFTSYEDLRKLDSFEIDTVVHLAAVTGRCSEEEGLDVNVSGTRKLLRYMADRGIRKFVISSSVAATGCLDKRFIPDMLPIPDNHPCYAYDAYGLSKALMENVAAYFGRIFNDIDITLFRYGAVIDREKTSQPAQQNKSQLALPFVQMARIDIRDVTRANIMAINAEHKPGVRIFNIVGPKSSCNYPVIEVLRQSLGNAADRLDLSNYAAPGHEYDPIYAMDKIKEEIGFVPEIDLS